jgi:MFS transporter, PPP family, 3-phenylpropionic acid transporter
MIGGVSLPFFGAWLAWKGLSPTQIGTLFSLGMMLRILVVPITGIVADARNDRRGMMVFLGLVMAAGFGSLTQVSPPLLLFVAAVPANIATGAASPLLESVSIRIANRNGFDYGHVRVWASILFVAGNVASGVAVSVFGLIVIAPWLFIAGALNACAAYILPRAPAERPPGHLRARLRTTLAEAHELIRSPVFLIFLATASLDQGSHAVYYFYGGLYWRALGYPGWLIGVIFPLGVFAEIVFMSFSLRIFKSVGAVRLLTLGAICCVVRWTILALNPPFPFVVFAQVLHGGTFALAHLGAMYFILKAVPPRLSATAQSLYAVFSAGLAMGLATYASGPLYAAAGGGAYFLMTAMGLASLGFSLLLARSWHGGRVTRSASEEEPETI